MMTGLLLYAVMNTTTTIRNSGVDLSAAEVFSMLERYTLNGVLGHRRSSRVLQHRWCTPSSQSARQQGEQAAAQFSAADVDISFAMEA